MKEYLLTTDKFLNPKVESGAEAYGTLLLRLLLLQPGTNPLHPGMGVGLGPKYRFMLEDNMPELQERIQDQIATYLPIEFDSATRVYLKIKPSKYLLITIVSKDVQFIYDTEESDTPVEISDLVF